MKCDWLSCELIEEVDLSGVYVGGVIDFFGAGLLVDVAEDVIARLDMLYFYF